MVLTLFAKKIRNESAGEAAMPIAEQDVGKDGRIGRRQVWLLGAAAMLLARPALAARKVAHIGFIGPGSRRSGESVLDAFRGGLATLGWAGDGDGGVLDRWAENHAGRLGEIPQEL